MMATNEGEGSHLKLAELLMQVDTLKRKLKTCKSELLKLKKKLSKTKQLNKNTENYNNDLRKQVYKLNAEIHEQKKKKYKTDVETQTEEYTWTETDYYNYYYGGCSEAKITHEREEMPGTQWSDTPETQKVEMDQRETVPEVTVTQADVQAASKPIGADVASIADMLRATAEEALSQTGIVFDENFGMYYDHSTGFYYDSSSQLYYDANTGIYYYCDAENGRYMFHSKVDLPTPQVTVETCIDKKFKKSTKTKGVERIDIRTDKVRVEEHMCDMLSDRKREKRCLESHGRKPMSSSPELMPHRKKVAKNEREKKRHIHSAQPKKSKKKNGLHIDGVSKSKKKKKKKAKSLKQSSKTKTARDSSGESEPEEGEITTSDGEQEWTSSSSRSSSSSSESEMETQEVAEDVWPPCVRVTVVRSPVLQAGTLFILTADNPATIGREKDMQHAIIISEMGVSKFHAEVYFDKDQQCYMLVDQGSQNGTVINGNRILQPKAKCEPYPLAHGDEVKMADTVLSFHIHSGNDTCDGCEPGQVIAHLSRFKREETGGPALITEDKESLRQKGLKQMKVKYGLKHVEYEESKAMKNPRYKDRAESRRQNVGSEGSFYRDDASASVHVEISKVNKGRKMLEKMGWKKGEGLGKDGAGLKDPIQVKVRTNHSGLGAGTTTSMDDVSLIRTKTQENWAKARERFADTCQTNMPHP